jgi:hypothetical protein
MIVANASAFPNVLPGPPGNNVSPAKRCDSPASVSRKHTLPGV